MIVFFLFVIAFLGGAKLKKNHKIAFLIFSTLFFLVSCSNSKESKEPFDPKSHIAESSYADLSLTDIFEYTVAVGDVASPKLNRFELSFGEDDSILKLSIEIVDTENSRTHTAYYDSESNLFRVKIVENYQAESSDLFDTSLLQSAEALLGNLDADGPSSIYFLSQLSSGSVSADFPKDTELFLFQNDVFKRIPNLKSISSEHLHFFAVHSDSSFEEFPSYYIVDPKKI